MKKIIVPFIVLSSFVFTACKDDDTVNIVEKLPKSMTSVHSNLIFEYNAKNQLVKVTDKESNTEYAETIYSYAEDGKLLKFVNAWYSPNNVSTETYTVSYTSNTQVKVTDENNDYTLVTLNDKGQALSFNTLGEINSFTYDSKGNLVKIVGENVTTTASYNNDRGILSSVKSPSWVFLLSDFDLQYYSVNNPISVTEVHTAGGVTETYAVGYTYPIEHIIAGFPTRMSVNFTENGETNNEIYNITY